MKDYSREEIEDKLNCPGFYDGVVMVNKLFSFKSVEELLKHWRIVKVYLTCYETSILTVTLNGVQLEKVKPFKSEKDIELAKFIMVSLYV
ncbi:hypothetical protein [Mucilaginibacter aquaedulcis]|uniref:hypothetical protein n=1 Tax=Mucilaginibacter aquaedulcis TaxID=1187081 RepID=UPI0025B3092A|nr:hypothetical protein [Mucilaginibacter aquaedulcis]MDN3548185.1 hypothetical protein [Mucilaginibacter aquaedulcis]